MRVLIVRFAKDQSGATAIEYAVMASLMAVLLIGAVTALGTDLKALFTKISNNF